VTDVNVEPPDLEAFDSLLQYPDMEVDPHEYHHDEPGPSPAARPSRRSRFDLPSSNINKRRR